MNESGIKRFVSSREVAPFPDVIQLLPECRGGSSLRSAAAKPKEPTVHYSQRWHHFLQCILGTRQQPHAG